jgi:hypothetical protein
MTTAAIALSKFLFSLNTVTDFPVVRILEDKKNFKSGEHAYVSNSKKNISVVKDPAQYTRLISLMPAANKPGELCRTK